MVERTPYTDAQGHPEACDGRSGAGQPAGMMQASSLLINLKNGMTGPVSRDWSSCFTNYKAGQALEGVRREAVGRCP